MSTENDNFHGNSHLSISIVVLTFNRIESLKTLLSELTSLRYPHLEILVVDNFSDTPASTLKASFPRVEFLRSPANLGTTGRNIGMEKASGEIVICLDDDINGLTDESLRNVSRIFQKEDIAGVNFKVVEAVTGRITNWVHHKAVETHSDKSFDTYEITEGAVAFRTGIAKKAGFYPESFFISHEGPDLAFRIMNLGYRIIYTPEIAVTHAYSPLGRTSWRNYYFDTRNTFWLVARNCPVAFGSLLLVRQVGSMLLYSIRDGYLLWWLRGVRDGLLGWPAAWKQRVAMSPTTMQRIRQLDAGRPGIVYLLRKRLFQRGIRI